MDKWDFVVMTILAMIGAVVGYIVYKIVEMT